jgi:hypothetical protein
MKNLTHLIMAALFATVILIFAINMAMAQDIVKADPKHYKVEFENSQVRVLRATYGPHEKGVMLSRPQTVGVALTDIDLKFTFPGGKTKEIHLKAEEVTPVAAGTRQPENLSDKPFEAILVELKAVSAKTK